MKIFLILFLISGIFLVPQAFGDVEEILSFMPNHSNLSEGWKIGTPKTASDVSIQDSNEKLNGAAQQFALNNERPEDTSILVTLRIFEFRNSEVSTQMHQANKQALQQSHSEVLKFSDDYPVDCYGVIENKNLQNEKSIISCSAENFVLISTSEQTGNVYENEKRVYTAATSVAFADFVIKNIINQKPLPDWIKNNAKWWSQGIMSDSEFVHTMAFLIQQGIIKVPQTTITSDYSSTIPDWVKINAEWWSKGAITDDEFIQSLQFLIENGIISIQT